MRLFYFNVRMLVILMMIISLEVPCFLCSSLNSLSFNASHDRALSQNSDWNIELSCLNSRTPDTRAPYGAFCAFANWQAARLYDASTFTYSDPGLPLTSQTHFSYAQYLFATWLSAIGSISSSKYPNKACTDAVQRLACTQAFPECPQSGVTATSVAYLPPCRLQCEQVRAFCGIQATATLPGSSGALSCLSYQTENCIIYIPTGYFVPSFDEGPYGNLSTMYSVLTAVWVLLTAWWIRQAFFVHSKSCVRLCKSVSVVPATKCITVLFTLAFWVTCDSWKMCSSALAVVVANCQLVYESTVIWMFLCVALGWEEVDSERSGQKVRRVTGATLLFYACASALMIGKQSNISRVKYLALIVTLYSAAYGYIAYSAHSNVRAVQKDVSLLLQHQVPDGYLRPLRYKLSSRAAFLVLVLLVIVAEAVVHAMMNSSAGFGAAIMIYELLNVLLITSVLYAYRPQEYNPFYFMQRVGGAHDVRDDERRGVATVEVQAEAVGKAAPFAADVELLPLIAHRDEVAMPARLVVVRCPASLAVATSVEMS